MRTFYIISETEMKEVGMMPPDIRFYKELKKAGLWTVNNTKVYNLEMDKWEKHLAAAQTFQHRLNKKGLVSEEDIEWGWYVKTESYQGEGHHVFKTEKEAIENYKEWSKWNGNLQTFTHKPLMVAIPKEEKRWLPKLDTPIISEEDLKEWEKEEKEERTFTEKDMIGFAEWMFDEVNPFVKHEGRWVQACGNSTSWTTAELLTKYLKQQ